jgi:hypothetical protein
MLPRPMPEMMAEASMKDPYGGEPRARKHSRALRVGLDQLVSGRISSPLK